jgi:hypothetical protein
MFVLPLRAPAAPMRAESHPLPWMARQPLPQALPPPASLPPEGLLPPAVPPPSLCQAAREAEASQQEAAAPSPALASAVPPVTKRKQPSPDSPA